jgi:hypothetical protein
MVYGPLLSKPIVIDDWVGIEEKIYWGQGITEINGKVVDLSKTNDLDPGDLKGRPYLDLALFWGTEWKRYVDEGKPLNEIMPEQAELSTPNASAAHGRFYPACGDKRAVLWLYTIKLATDDGLNLFSKFGVPIRTECR